MESVYAIQINNAGIEYSEQISIDLNIAVITTCLPLGNSAADSNAGTSPSPASIIAVCEDVVANCYVTDTGLLEPDVTVALKEDRGSGDLELVVFDDNPSAGTNQQTAGAVSRHPATADVNIGTGFVGCNQMAGTNVLG